MVFAGRRRPGGDRRTPDGVGGAVAGRRRGTGRRAIPTRRHPGRCREDQGAVGGGDPQHHGCRSARAVVGPTGDRWCHVALAAPSPKVRGGGGHVDRCASGGGTPRRGVAAAGSRSHGSGLGRTTPPNPSGNRHRPHRVAAAGYTPTSPGGGVGPQRGCHRGVGRTWKGDAVAWRGAARPQRKAARDSGDDRRRRNGPARGPTGPGHLVVGPVVGDRLGGHPNSGASR